jgi:hypothetical protein
MVATRVPMIAVASMAPGVIVASMAVVTVIADMVALLAKSLRSAFQMSKPLGIIFKGFSLLQVGVKAFLVLGIEPLAVADHGHEVLGGPLRGMLAVIVSIVIRVVVLLRPRAGLVVKFKVRHGDRSRMRGGFRVVTATRAGGHERDHYSG